MKKSKFTERQIVNILKEYEAGKSTNDICREHGIAPPTFYSWKRKYEGMDAKQLQEYKARPNHPGDRGECIWPCLNTEVFLGVDWLNTH